MRIEGSENIAFTWHPQYLLSKCVNLGVLMLVYATQVNTAFRAR